MPGSRVTFVGDGMASVVHGWTIVSPGLSPAWPAVTISAPAGIARPRRPDAAWRSARAVNPVCLRQPSSAIHQESKINGQYETERRALDDVRDITTLGEAAGNEDRCDGSRVSA